MRAEHRISLARVYDEPSGPGYRVLVDRLWPRGVSRDEGAFDEWLKEVAPSTDLRRWYGHDPARFEEFADRYRAELELDPARQGVDRLRELAASDGVVLVTATRDVDHSGARVLRDHLEGAGARAAPAPPPLDPDLVVDEWGRESFPASDPPGSLPPSLEHEAGAAERL